MNEKKPNITLFENSPFTVEKLLGRGGSFLVIPCYKGEVFSREKFSEDHRMFEQAALDFAQKKIKPQYKKLNKLKNILLPNTMGELFKTLVLKKNFDKFKPLLEDFIKGISCP